MSEPVFQPEYDGISDAEWLDLCQRASGGSERFFTANQLYLSYARNKVKVTRFVARRGGFGLLMIVVGLSIWIYALKVDWGLTLVAGIAITLSGVAMVGTGVVTQRDPAAREPITRWLAQWTAARGAGKLLSEPTLGASSTEYAPEHADCIIVVERDILVDLLLKNGAHETLDALVVGESGYPAGLAAEARKLLTERAELPVIALHDATAAGVAMCARLQKSGTFPLSQRAVVDAGLFPADVTWLAELAPAIPASHTNRVPLDSLSFDALMVGLRGVKRGALSLHQAIDQAHDARTTELPQGADALGDAPSH